MTQFHGLFIGIDRYKSPKINCLGFAKRDAMALHALFNDNLGGECVFMADEEATRSAIENELQKLQGCSEDDVVVITFSGHGSPTHELVTHDTVPENLEQTGIPLSLLTEWFSKIPAKKLIFLLDCCFSGGMGAKVLQVDAIPRDLESEESLLQKMSGEGRVILTAANAKEPAWEISRFKHGLLTHHFIEALLGKLDAQKAGKISLYKLLEQVVQSVVDSAKSIRKEQHPTLRGTIDEEVLFPVFEIKEHYKAAFPEICRPKVTEKVSSLKVYGFPEEVLQAWQGAIPSLNELQIAAINDYGIFEGNHLLVSAPTSSGKTMIGELGALKGITQGQKAIFLFPLKALVNDKHRYFNTVYAPFNVKTIRATGDSTDDIPDLIQGQYDICLMTYEKFTALVLNVPHILGQVGTVVIDEVQMIADTSRGVNLEFILTLLKVKRLEGIEPQLIALSAVIGDTNGLENWLGASLLKKMERPVDLHEGIINSSGTFRSINPKTNDENITQNYILPEMRSQSGSSQNYIIPLTRKLVADGKQVIVFRATRGEARGCAKYLAQSLGLPPANEEIAGLPTGDVSMASNDLRNCLLGGVAFHISDLDRDERLVVEEGFRKPDSKIRVIVATTTLAMGVNTPAEAVIITGLEHPGNPPKPYFIAEYKNMVGRAGRLGFSEVGESFLLALNGHQESHYWGHYVLGAPEDIESQFLSRGTDLRSLIIRVLIAGSKTKDHFLTADEIVDFLENSFGAFQQARFDDSWTWNRDSLFQAIHNLEENELIEKVKDGYSLTELGWLTGQGGVEVESIVRIINALKGMNATSINEMTLITATQMTVELDALYFPLNKKSTQKEPIFWRNGLLQRSVPSTLISFLQRGIDQIGAIVRAKKAVACLLWMSETPLNEIEKTMTQFGGGLNGAAGSVRQVASRTHDLLPTVMRIAEILHSELDMGERGKTLLARLEVGVPNSLGELAIHFGSRLTRNDYFSLMQKGLNTMEAIINAPDEQLLSCFGGSDVERKLASVRDAIQNYGEEKMERESVGLLLPKYES